MKNNSIRSVVATGIGAALFVVIGMISIPTPVPNDKIIELTEIAPFGVFIILNSINHIAETA